MLDYASKKTIFLTLIFFFKFSLLGCSPQLNNEPNLGGKTSDNVTKSYEELKDDYSDLINKIADVNKVLNNLSCKAKEGTSFLGEKAKPIIEKGFNKSIEVVQNYIPNTWKDNSQEFINVSEIIYKELKINLRYLPPNDLPSVDITNPGTIKTRYITLKEFPGGGKIVIDIPCDQNLK